MSFPQPSKDSISYCDWEDVSLCLEVLALSEVLHLAKTFVEPAAAAAAAAECSGTS